MELKIERCYNNRVFPVSNWLEGEDRMDEQIDKPSYVMSPYMSDMTER